MGGAFQAGQQCPPTGPCACASDAECQERTDNCTIGLCSNPGPGGTCEFAPVDCFEGNKDCTEASCDLAGAVGNCDTVTLVPDGTMCDEGNRCSVGERCQSGLCGGGTPVDCSDAGDQCNTGTCAPGGMEGNCDGLTPVFNGTACDDGDACTVGETCQDGGCTGGSVPDCSSAGDQCNTASCDPDGAEGNCDTVTPSNEGGPCESDGDPCTNDVCRSGVCRAEGIPGCPVQVCLIPGVPGSDGSGDCLLPVRVHIGWGEDIVGFQARVEYDPLALQFEYIEPGNDCDPNSEFTSLLYVETGEGWVFFAATTGDPVACSPANCPGADCECADWQTCDAASELCAPVGQGSSGGVDVACLYFSAPAGNCQVSEVCFCEDVNGGPEACNPYQLHLVNGDGVSLQYQNSDEVCPEGACPEVTPDAPIEMNCPGNIEVKPGCGETAVEIGWDVPTAVDECSELDFDPVTDCTCNAPPAACEDWLANNGGVFPQGSWTFDCTATDKRCGETGNCSWTVTVDDEHVLELVVELSANIVPDAIDRCLHFELYSTCTPLVVTDWEETFTFGGPYNFPGHFQGTIWVPKGEYSCVTARDPLHTLRAVSSIECDGTVYHAIFKGDPFFSGNWLTGGNLDGNGVGSPHVIDIVDYGLFVSQFLHSLDPNTPCGYDLDYRHADINGDGLVDDGDFTFIALNFMETDKDLCCPGSRYTITPGRTSISVRELRMMGLTHAVVADLNGDGMVDLHDMAAFLSGARPKTRYYGSAHGRGP